MSDFSIALYNSDLIVGQYNFSVLHYSVVVLCPNEVKRRAITSGETFLVPIPEECEGHLSFEVKIIENTFGFVALVEQFLLDNRSIYELNSNSFNLWLSHPDTKSLESAYGTSPLHMLTESLEVQESVGIHALLFLLFLLLQWWCRVPRIKTHQKRRKPRQVVCSSDDMLVLLLNDKNE